MTTKIVLMALIATLSAVLVHLAAFWEPTPPGPISGRDAQGQLPPGEASPQG